MIEISSDRLETVTGGARLLHTFSTLLEGQSQLLSSGFSR